MIVVVDYGMGNLRSVSKALEHLGADVRISASAKDIEIADKIVLPGVGAFGDAMKEIREHKLEAPLREFANSKKPFLGVCLGLQLLFEKSEESPGCLGLGIFKGAVRRFRSKNVKIPHMGWNTSKIVRDHALTKNLENNSYFYFVHTFYVVPENETINTGMCEYGSETFSAMVGNDTIFATQFHPEKSQEAGLQILKNFIEWKP